VRTHVVIHRSLASVLLALTVACGDDGSGGDTGGTDTGETSGDPGDTGADGSSGGSGSATGSGTGATNGPTTGTTDGASTSGNTGDTTTDSTDSGVPCVDDHRVVAFLANWQACPTADQLAAYSHVVIAFAVSYTWDPGGNICDESCTIMPVAGCAGTSLNDLVSDLHAAGTKVLVSFGGAGMGGTWEGTCGNMTKCWDYCLDRVESVATQLTDIVVAADLDGVDIDYEYCLHTPTHTGFVEDLTTTLRERLDAAFPGEHKLITHAPMDSELDSGDPYYEIVRNNADVIDFLMPQYYNGGLSPFSPQGLAAIHDHYDLLVNDVYGGDASRVVFGYCIEPGCNPVATQPEALEVIQQLDGWYPGNGGVFFWAHPNDDGAWFSRPFRDYYDETYCE
jgi:chitinase